MEAITWYDEYRIREAPESVYAMMIFVILLLQHPSEATTMNAQTPTNTRSPAWSKDPHSVQIKRVDENAKFSLHELHKGPHEPGLHCTSESPQGESPLSLLFVQHDAYKPESEPPMQVSR